MRLTDYRRAIAIVLLGLAQLAGTTPPQIRAESLEPISIPPHIIPPVMATAPPAQPSPLAPVVESVRVEAIKQHIPLDTSTRTTPAPPASTVHELIVSMTTARFGASQVDLMMELVRRESGFNPYARNPRSGACGLPQSLPCSKLLSAIGSLDNVAGQIRWMLDYVANRYGTPAGAIAHHNAKNWY